MTSQQKAAELIEKFINHVDTEVIFDDVKVIANNSANAQIINAKKCALIAVEEIIKAVPMFIGKPNPDYNFWQQVRVYLKSN